VHYFVKAVGGYLMLAALIFAAVIIFGAFSVLVDTFSLGRWLSHGGFIQLAVIAGIAGFYIGMTKYQKVAGSLWIITGLSVFFAFGLWINGY